MEAKIIDESEKCGPDCSCQKYKDLKEHSKKHLLFLIEYFADKVDTDDKNEFLTYLSAIISDICLSIHYILQLYDGFLPLSDSDKENMVWGEIRMRVAQMVEKEKKAREKKIEAAFELYKTNSYKH